MTASPLCIPLLASLEIISLYYHLLLGSKQRLHEVNHRAWTVALSSRARPAGAFLLRPPAPLRSSYSSVRFSLPTWATSLPVACSFVPSTPSLESSLAFFWAPPWAKSRASESPYRFLGSARFFWPVFRVAQMYVSILSGPQPN